MESYIQILEANRQAIMANWLREVLPEFKNAGEKSSLTRFENPLLFQVSHEFQKLFDFMRSQDTSINPPVAEILIKFYALNSGTSTDIIRYPVILKDCILSKFNDTGVISESQMSVLYQKTEQLLLSACLFYIKTREDIYNIKINEIRNGALSDESLGMTGAVCPSAIVQTHGK